jgi:dTDP-4-amino-4,6-dideoxygalactose transaminase
MNLAKPRIEVPFHRASLGEEEVREVAEVIRSGWLTMGPKTVGFERDFAHYTGVTHAIAVSSCTAALHLALEALGIRPGDEVLVPTLTFAATAEVVTYLGARPVFVDSEPSYFNISPDDIERKVTQRTRAIMPVHFGGHPCAMDRIQALADSKGLPVVEDAAHALPAKVSGRMIGSLSDVTAFSFYATKTVTTGEGGMLTTNNDALADRVRLMRLHGMSRDAWKRYSGEGSWRYEILEAGFKYNFTDLQAALGVIQLSKCDALRTRRAALAELYTSGLAGIDGFRTPRAQSDMQHAWHLYYVLIEARALRIDRDAVIRELNDRGIGTSVHFLPLHLQPYYQKRWGYRAGDFPVAEDYAGRCISLPIYPDMTNQEAVYVVDCLRDIAQQFRR